jgi:outer membrane protein TolC
MRPFLAALLLAAAAPALGAPLTLDDALTEAAQANPDLAAARADVDAAGADRTTAWSGVLPRLDLQAAFGHTFTGTKTGVGLILNPITNQVLLSGAATDTGAYSAGLTLTQPVFDWKAFRTIDEASWNARASARQYDETALTVAFTVTQTFYGLVRAERILAVLEKTAARSQELVGRADALFTAGRAPKSDTWSARANLAQDRINIEAQRIEVATARTALAQALGRADGEGLTVIAPAALDAPGLPSPEAPPLEALLARARERRPTLAGQRALVEASQAGIGTAQAGWLPALSAQASYARQGSTLAGSGGVYDNPSRDYTATAQLLFTWNLFAGRSTEAAVHRAQASLAHARASQDKVEQGVAKEIADARARVTTLASQAALSAESLEVARQGLALASERFQAGLANQLEIRDASLKLTQAELSLAQARIDHTVALADLARAVGGAL